MIGSTAKSGRFSYYRCNNALRHGADVCRSGWLSKDKIEGFIVDKLKDRVLTDDNLTKLVRLVNEEIRLTAGQRQDRLRQVEEQLETVNQMLLKYYLAFENGKLKEEDAAPRIRQLREEQTRLQKAREDILGEEDDVGPRELDKKDVLEYARDLKGLLSAGTITEQKGFIRSFIKRIDFEPGQVTVNYTIPMPVDKDVEADREVLCIGNGGEPGGIRTRDALIKSQIGAF
jgi:hypothetical protein